MCMNSFNTHRHPVVLFTKSNSRIRIFSADRSTRLPARPHTTSDILVNTPGRVELSSYGLIFGDSSHFTAIAQTQSVFSDRQGALASLVPRCLSSFEVKKRKIKLLQFESKVSPKGPWIKALILNMGLLGGSGPFKRWSLMHRSLWGP